MSKKLIIIGTGAFAEVVHAYFQEYTQYTTVAFACDAEFKQAETYAGLPLYELDDLEVRFPPQEYVVFVAVGYRKMNKIRQDVYQRVKNKGFTCASFVHPGVKIWSSTTIGENVFIFEDNTIQPFTAIGNNTTLWSGNHLGHHSKIGPHTFISSHVVISGACKIGANVFVGINAAIRDGVTIADETLIGAGALIMQDTAVRSVYMPDGTMPRKVTSNRVGF